MATYLQGKPGIYKITNTVNNKIYIGCASNIRTRINGHLYDLRKNMHKIYIYVNIFGLLH